LYHGWKGVTQIMPTKREREYYRMGFADGQRGGFKAIKEEQEIKRPTSGFTWGGSDIEGPFEDWRLPAKRKPKRKLSAWNKFVKANSKKPRFVLRSGKLNLKKMGVAFRKTPAGKKKRR